MSILGGSWVLTSRVTCTLNRVRSIVTILIALPVATHEPPSRGFNPKFKSLRLKPPTPLEHS